MKELLVLGPGCARCEMLADRVKEAAEQLGIEHEITKFTDPNAIAGFGVMTTPALIIDGELKFSGKVPSVEELKKMLA
jgi:small redox-active disulfide protein 2